MTKKRTSIFAVIALCLIASLMLTACGKQKEQPADIEDLEYGIETETEGFDQFTLNGQVIVTIPEGYRPDETFWPDIDEGYPAMVSFINNDTITETIDVFVDASDSLDAEEYTGLKEKAQRQENTDDTTYGTIKTKIGTMYYKHVTSDTKKSKLTGEGLEGPDDILSKLPSIHGIMKIEDEVLIVNMQTVEYDETNSTVTYRHLGQDDLDKYIKYVMSFNEPETPEILPGG